MKRKKEEKQKIRSGLSHERRSGEFSGLSWGQAYGRVPEGVRGGAGLFLSERKDEIPGPRYVLVVHQGETVRRCFSRRSLEVNCYDYGEVGHFWMKGWEYLRLLEYRLAILRDKRDYLGESFCSREEVALGADGFPASELLLLSFCFPRNISFPGKNPGRPTRKLWLWWKEWRKKWEIGAFFSSSAFIGGFFLLSGPFSREPASQNAHAPLVDLLAERLKKQRRRFTPGDPSPRWKAVSIWPKNAASFWKPRESTPISSGKSPSPPPGIPSKAKSMWCAGKRAERAGKLWWRK